MPIIKENYELVQKRKTLIRMLLSECKEQWIEADLDCDDMRFTIKTPLPMIEMVIAEISVEKEIAELGFDILLIPCGTEELRDAEIQEIHAEVEKLIQSLKNIYNHHYNEYENGIRFSFEFDILTLDLEDFLQRVKSFLKMKDYDFVTFQDELNKI
jgi:hypothetical protein